jgi:ferric-dicitrate binding protein FerR (iron transport regulator)
MNPIASAVPGRIRLDIPDPKVAALTVSGGVPISEPDRVLWAVAQVHGLKLDRLDERHYRLRSISAKSGSGIASMSSASR